MCINFCNFGHFSENPWKRLELFVGFRLQFASLNYLFASNLGMVSFWWHDYIRIILWNIYMDMLWIKFFLGLFPTPMPRWLVILWSSVGVGLLAFLMMWTWRFHPSLSKKQKRLWIRLPPVFLWWKMGRFIECQHTCCKFYSFHNCKFSLFQPRFFIFIFY